MSKLYEIVEQWDAGCEDGLIDTGDLFGQLVAYCEGLESNIKDLTKITPKLFYVVAHNSEDDLSQITNGLTYEKAESYRDSDFCKGKWPNAFIVASLTIRHE